MKLFWDQDRGGRNFGDAFTPWLFARYGQSVEWAPAEQADVIGVGSLAEAIPAGYGGWLFGTGKMFGHTQLDLRAAHVAALRGPLTGEGSRAACDLYADPVLLAIDYVQPDTERDWKLGTIRHYVDRRHTPDAHEIDVLGPIEQVIAEAARCEWIVASSLHGLVLADALGIASMWDPHPRVMGEGFKFRDYAAGYGEVIVPGVWRYPNVALIERKRGRLRQALAGIIDAL